MPNRENLNGPLIDGPDGRPLFKLNKRLIDIIHRLDDGQQNAATVAAQAQETAEAAASADITITGTNGVTVLGDAESGFTVQGPGTEFSRGIPGRDGEDGQDAWPIPGPKGDPGPPAPALYLLQDFDAGEPWPMAPGANNDGFLAHTAPLLNGAAAATGTLGNAPAAGNPTKWVAIDDAGTTRYVPAW